MKFAKTLLVLMFILQAVITMNAHSQSPQEQIVNPVIEQRADPWVYLHTDGFYYFTASVPEYDRLELRRASTIQGLADAEPVVIWEKYDSGPMSRHIWAPELHYIDGNWYIYFAAGREDEPFAIRMYVLENEAENPLEQSWVERGAIETRWDSFSLDATSFEHEGVRYLVWAQHDPDIRGNTNLYIAEMSNPWTIIQPQVMITTPEYEWERRRFLVNEGAAVLNRNGRIFITYSASATNHYYAMGLLTADENSDLLDPASWSKSPEPVFRTTEETSQYGPGHNSFTVAPDGTDILIYHARNYQEIDGDPLYDPNRHTRAQVIHWNSDGTPNFGVPVPDGPLPVRLQAEAGYVYPEDGRIALTNDVARIENSQFRVVPGLADADAVSYESMMRPGHFLRHRDGQILLEEHDGSDEFAADATWTRHAAEGDGFSLEAHSQPGQFIQPDGGGLVLGEGDAAVFRDEF